jgi:diaminopimelate epimerase
MKIPFTKMHGLGNDFMIVDCTERDLQFKPELIKKLSDRNFGVGFDQLLLVEKASTAEVDFHYRIFNTDGTEVEHCGNGARCFATFVRDKGLSRKNLINVSTINRNLKLTLHGDGEISVDMGPPEFDPSKIPFLCDSRLDTHERFIKISDEKTAISFSVLSMGNPHAVVCVEDLANTAVKDIGKALVVTRILLRESTLDLWKYFQGI